MTKVIKNAANLLPTETDEVYKIKINRDTQKFFVDERSDVGEFSSFKLRPLEIMTKLKSYTEDFEVSTETTLFKDLKEAFDSRGNSAKENGKLCGRLIWKKDTDALSEDMKKVNKDKAKFYAFIFGIAYIEGKSPMLIDLQVGGGKYMEVVNLMKKIKADKGDYSMSEILVKAYKSEEYDWPELEFMLSPDAQTSIGNLEELCDTIDNYITAHNARIVKKIEKNKAPKRR